MSGPPPGELAGEQAAEDVDAPVAFRAACVQMRSGLDRESNLAAALELIAEAARRGAHLIVTPEMTNVLDRDGAKLRASLPVEAGLAEVGAFAAAAAAHGVWLLIGSMAVGRSDGRLANRSFLFGPDGEIAARYDKMHMFDVDLATGESWRESRVYAPGETAVVASTPLGKIGLSICYDLRFPHLYRAMARAGASVMTVPAAFTRTTGRAHWRTLLTARAIECGAYVIAAAQGGVHEDGRETYGHSMIIGPWGDVLAEAKGDEPCVILAEIDPEKVARVRREIPSLQLGVALEKPPEVLTVGE